MYSIVLFNKKKFENIDISHAHAIIKKGIHELNISPFFLHEQLCHLKATLTCR